MQESAAAGSFMPTARAGELDSQTLTEPELALVPPCRALAARPLLVASVVLAPACRLERLPPPSSRLDRGPVSARGVISLEARSQVRLYRDAAGCESVQTMNRQFRVVTVPAPVGMRPLVLEEAYDLRHCLSTGSASSEAVITAWRPEPGVVDPLFRITGRGVTGEPVGTFYRLLSRSCCGGNDLGVFHSLHNGRALFSSSGRVLQLVDSVTGGSRFVAFHDAASPVAPPEAAGDPTVIGVLQVGDDREPARRWVVVLARPEPFALRQLGFIVRSRPVPDTLLVLAGAEAAGDAAVLARLRAPTSGRELTVEVPFEGLSPRVDRVRASRGITLRPSP
jgi:hypothetical protein